VKRRKDEKLETHNTKSSDISFVDESGICKRVVRGGKLCRLLIANMDKNLIKERMYV
jgi:hypothetical protein